MAAFVGIKQGLSITVAPEDWIWIFIIGAVNSGFGCYLYFSSIAALPVQTVAVCGYLEPVTALVLAALILGERMSPVQLLGALLIIAGAMTAELLGKAKEKNVI